jgi:antitoxin ParD1/3/4
MAMTSLNISLPDPLKAYVEDRVATGDFGTPSEFIRNLIRQDKELRRSRLETELLDALQTKDLVISPEELNGRTLVSVLREKLARQ